jgi:hypothetical protein
MKDMGQGELSQNEKRIWIAQLGSSLSSGASCPQCGQAHSSEPKSPTVHQALPGRKGAEKRGPLLPHHPPSPSQSAVQLVHLLPVLSRTLCAS